MRAYRCKHPSVIPRRDGDGYFLRCVLLESHDGGAPAGATVDTSRLRSVFFEHVPAPLRFLRARHGDDPALDLRLERGRDAMNDELMRRVEAIHARNEWPLPKPRAAALRLLDEAVELCLVTGSGTQEIMAEVADVVHHEALKHHGTLPSQLSRFWNPGSPAAVMEELADMVIQTSWVIRRDGRDDSHVLWVMEEKIAKLERAETDGTLTCTGDGRLYRRAKT